jgi:tight adherence protein B
MVTTSLFLLGFATFCWPTNQAAHRLRALSPTRRAQRRFALPRPAPIMVTLAFGVGTSVLIGPLVGLAAAIAAATGYRRWSARHTTRTTVATIDGLAEAIRAAVAELRAGAHPATAAEAAAVDATPTAATVMRSIAAAARLDGDIHQALACARTTNPATAPVLNQISRAWILANRHGLPLADVLDAVRGDLETRARFARQLHARMAGPRASASILAILPAIGLALGEAMGAHPIRVLTTTQAGHLLTLLGVALICAGLTWSAHLTNQRPKAVIP